jgi:hypothetical protein
MNATQAINKIADLLGLKFKKEKFFKTKLIDGETEITNNMESDFGIGQTLYVVGESTLSPAPLGVHTTREGLVLTVDEESTITKIEEEVKEAEQEVVEDQVEVESSKEVKMVEAKDAQGQTLESSTFDVGEEVYVVGEDGSKALAPNGEHQVVLKDTEGNEVKIRIQTVDGKIVQRENVEGMSKDKEQDFSTQLDQIKLGINQLLEVVDSMNGKFKTDINSIKQDFETFKNAPERKPLEKKASFKESFEDFRFDFLKDLRK